MKRLIPLFLTAGTAFSQGGQTVIIGDTDGTAIGNTGTRLNVSATFPSTPTVTANQGTQGTSTSPWYINLRNASGTEIGTSGAPVRIDPTGSTTQPVSAASLPLPTGAATSSLQTTGNTSLSSIDTKTPALGQTTMSASSPVAIASNQTAIPVSQSGTWTTGRTWTLSSGTDSATAVQGAQGSSSSPWYINLRNASGTEIGTTSNPLYIDQSASTGVSLVNRTDISAQTITTSGNSSAFETAGMSFANFQIHVTAISGSGAYAQFHIQTSDDNSTWVTYVDTTRLTATGFTRYLAMRHPGRYYRFSWDVAGTTPSITFTVNTTIKPASAHYKSSRVFYSDLDLTNNGNVSTTFPAEDCGNVAVLFTRGADGGNNGTIQLFASNDSATWVSISGNLAANVSTTNSTTVLASAWRFYQLEVTVKTSAGTRVLDVQWSCN